MQHLVNKDFSQKVEFKLRIVSFFYEDMLCGMKFSAGVSLVLSQIRSRTCISVKQDKLASPPLFVLSLV